MSRGETRKRDSDESMSRERGEKRREEKRREEKRREEKRRKEKKRKEKKRKEKKRKEMKRKEKKRKEAREGGCVLRLLSNIGCNAPACDLSLTSSCFFCACFVFFSFAGCASSGYTESPG